MVSERLGKTSQYQEVEVTENNEILVMSHNGHQSTDTRLEVVRATRGRNVCAAKCDRGRGTTTMSIEEWDAMI